MSKCRINIEKNNNFFRKVKMRILGQKKLQQKVKKCFEIKKFQPKNKKALLILKKISDEMTKSHLLTTNSKINIPPKIQNALKILKKKIFTK